MSQCNDNDNGNSADLSQFSMRDLFRMEAESQTQILTDGLLAMEQLRDDAGAVDAMMRAAHSIKGAAAIVGLDVVVQLAHGMEDAFIAAQQGKLALTAHQVDALLAGVDLILQLSQLPEPSLAPWLGSHGARITQTLAAIATLPYLPEPLPRSDPTAQQQQPLQAARPGPVSPLPTTSKTAHNFDRLLALSNAARIHAHHLRPYIQNLQRYKRSQASLFALIEQLQGTIAGSSDAGLKEKSLLALQKSQPLKQSLLEHIADLEAYERRVLAVSAGMVDEVLALRMRPFRDGVLAFPRMVRDLARTMGKDVQLQIIGDDTLVDRDILARIESPLNHILRNAVDHGMDTAAGRITVGKPGVGVIVLEAKHRAGMLSITISDDGRGVDTEKIRTRVVDRKMVGAQMAASLSAAELMEFLFLPAFSLKDNASEISGRGVGLDIVQETVRAQNGTVRIESTLGQGFRTIITLPLTQSIVRALVVDISGEAYAIPIAQTERVLKVQQSTIHTLENKQFFEVEGVHLGLVSATQVLQLDDTGNHGDELPVVVIGSGARRYALVVEAIRGERSLAVQATDPVFGKMRDIAAAALLDDGEPVLILDVPDLLLSIDKLLHEGGLQQLAQPAQAERRKTKRILVVDDSLTVREMERKLLLGRGFDVDVAIDGVDGWNVVRSGDYDLLITDVDMPRMDGIELVTLIRSDMHLHKLPVMIVSYKDRPEDRARGLAAGADYYLTKGSFHDETLLDAVTDLIGEARQ